MKSLDERLKIVEEHVNDDKITIMIIGDIIQIGDMETILILIGNLIEKIMIMKMKKKEKLNWKKKEYYLNLRKNMVK